MPVAEFESQPFSPPKGAALAPRLSHLRLLEAESIHILREVASEFERPVMLYSIGKDSSGSRSASSGTSISRQYVETSSESAPAPNVGRTVDKKTAQATRIRKRRPGFWNDLD